MAWALVGYGVAAAGVALAVWAWSVLGSRRLVSSAHEPPNPVSPRLVFGGPYRLVRHPFLLAALLGLGGAAIATRWPWLWVGWATAVVVLPWLTVREERRLVARFGEAYRRYQRAVPMLVPRPRRGAVSKCW